MAALVKPTATHNVSNVVAAAYIITLARGYRQANVVCVKYIANKMYCVADSKVVPRVKRRTSMQVATDFTPLSKPNLGNGYQTWHESPPLSLQETSYESLHL